MEYEKIFEVVGCPAYSEDEEGTIRIWVALTMSKDNKSPREADPKMLWALLRTKYRDGDEMVDEEGLIWDVWRKSGGYVLYCIETKEIIDIPIPEELK